MKPTTNLLGFSILVSLILLSGCTMTGKTIKEEPVILGYCPTMAGHSEEIQSKNTQITRQAYPSTHAVLSALNKGQIDIALVGRIAKQNELEHPSELRLREGLTLVGREKRLIPLEELKDVRIHTYLSEEKVREYLPDTEEIIYHPSFEEAIRKGMIDIVLIDWKDYTDSLELVIPIDIQMNKIERFRLPTLYSSDPEHITSLKR